MKLTFLAYLFSRRWPMQLLVLGGLLFAMIRWKRHPKVSLLTISGLVLFLTQSLTFGTIFYLLPRLHDQGWSYGGINNLYLVASVCRDIVYSGVIVLLVSAAFSQRTPKAAISEAGIK